MSERSVQEAVGEIITKINQREELKEQLQVLEEEVTELVEYWLESAYGVSQGSLVVSDNRLYVVSGIDPAYGECFDAVNESKPGLLCHIITSNGNPGAKTTLLTSWELYDPSMKLKREVKARRKKIAEQAESESVQPSSSAAA